MPTGSRARCARLIAAVQQLGKGDRSARANLVAPGELGELAAAVDAMAAALEREDELRRALTADVAHELRTPVTILTAQCEAIIDGVAPPDAAELGSLYDEVLRLGRVIEDLEALSSAEAAGLRLDRARVDLAGLVEETSRLLAPQFAASDVRLVTDLAPASVEGDRLRLAQVVRNLLSNALKFTPAGGTVEIAVGVVGGRVELRVPRHGRRHTARGDPLRVRPVLAREQQPYDVGQRHRARRGRGARPRARRPRCGVEPGRRRSDVHRRPA